LVRIIVPEDLVRGLQSAAVLVVAAKLAALGRLFRDPRVRADRADSGARPRVIVFDEAE
jgi:hypothetical protein